METTTQAAEFKTSETALAAYLLSLGFSMIHIQYNTFNRGTFIFDANDARIGDFIQAYNRCEAQGNINLYENARRKLLDRVKNGLH